jgi:hypothetical protein
LDLYLIDERSGVEKREKIHEMTREKEKRREERPDLVIFDIF